jgi:hypothetical protein
LAFTGIDAIPLVVLALMLLIGGGLGVRAMRRRIAQLDEARTEKR